MRGIGRYRSSQVENAPKHQLVLLLFQEASRRLLVLEGAAGSDARWPTNTHHVREIYYELLDALDDGAAPELCARLRPIYQWVISELVVAGSERSAARVEAVRKVNDSLLEGWFSAIDRGLRRSA